MSLMSDNWKKSYQKRNLTNIRRLEFTAMLRVITKVVASRAVSNPFDFSPAELAVVTFTQADMAALKTRSRVNRGPKKQAAPPTETHRHVLPRCHGHHCLLTIPSGSVVIGK